MANTDQHGPDPVDQLLEWHLNLLDAESAGRLEAELRRNADLRVKSQRLGRVLRPLDHWAVHTGPPNLSENILEAVRRGGGVPAAPVERRRTFLFPFTRMRDVIAAAACIVVLMGVFVPGASALRSRSQRALCANNMHAVALGLGQYQASFGGALPFAGFAPDSNWLTGDDPTCYASNSRHVFLLFKHGFVTKPNTFLCPSNKDAAPMKVAGLEACDDFREGNNISYDSHNLAGTAPNLRPTAVIAYLADPNPLFIGAKFNGNVDPQKNSPAHGGCGQTVLMVDGRAEYLRTPMLSQRKDNVWTIEGVSKYFGRETPTRLDDSFLVPGLPKIHR